MFINTNGLTRGFVTLCYNQSKAPESQPQHRHICDKQHLLFLIVCKMLCPELDVTIVSAEHPHGGKIGIGNSYLNCVFRYSKILRLHAAFHDAFGLTRRLYNIGPGYGYASPIALPNICFLGHISGLMFWLMVFTFHRRLYNLISV